MVPDTPSVTLDLVELSIKGQYIGRSDMWRLRKQLIDTSVFLGKQVSFAGMQARVHDLWTSAEKVSCGLIRPNTKIVFRTMSGMYHVLIQVQQLRHSFL